MRRKRAEQRPLLPKIARMHRLLIDHAGKARVQAFVVTLGTVPLR